MVWLGKWVLIDLVSGQRIAGHVQTIETDQKGVVIACTLSSGTVDSEVLINGSALATIRLDPSYPIQPELQ